MRIEKKESGSICAEHGGGWGGRGREMEVAAAAAAAQREGGSEGGNDDGSGGGARVRDIWEGKLRMRRLQTSDEDVVKEMHENLFPVTYTKEFYAAACGAVPMRRDGNGGGDATTMLNGSRVHDAAQRSRDINTRRIHSKRKNEYRGNASPSILSVAADIAHTDGSGRCDTNMNKHEKHAEHRRVIGFVTAADIAPRPGDDLEVLLASNERLRNERSHTNEPSRAQRRRDAAASSSSVATHTPSSSPNGTGAGDFWTGVYNALRTPFVRTQVHRRNDGNGRHMCQHEEMPGLEGTGFRSGRDFGRHEKVLYILTLGVVPEFQNMGVAKRLVRTLLDGNMVSHAVAALHTMESNAKAINFYHKLGFETVLRIERFYTLKDGSRHPGLLLAKKLAYAPLTASNVACEIVQPVTDYRGDVSEEADVLDAIHGNLSIVVSTLRVWIRSLLNSLVALGIFYRVGPRRNGRLLPV